MGLPVARAAAEKTWETDSTHQEASVSVSPRKESQGSDLRRVGSGFFVDMLETIFFF